MSVYNPQPGDPISALDTPSMLVDLDLMEANISTFLGRLLPTGVLVRPHLKTTKSAALAARLAAAGATGGCVAKLSEAEALCAAGFDDLLITSPVVGPHKCRRLAALFQRHRGLRIVVDDVRAARAIDGALASVKGLGGGDDGRLATLIDVDVGLHRTGVAGAEAARALAAAVREGCPRLKVVGVQGYEGHVQHVHGRAARRAQCLESMAALVDAAAALRADGHEVRVVTGGGTGTAAFCAGVEGVTEVQPGSFLFMDTDYRDALRDGEGGDSDDQDGNKRLANSLTILSTVLSRQGPRCVTIDAGLKSLTTDSGLAEAKEPGYTYGVLGDEHGSLSWGEGAASRPLDVGDRVEMIPSHIDPTINLHDVYYAHRGGVIEEIWRVDARGKVQ